MKRDWSFDQYSEIYNLKTGLIIGYLCDIASYLISLGSWYLYLQRLAL